MFLPNDLSESGTMVCYHVETREKKITHCRNLLGCKKYISTLKNLNAVEMVKVLYNKMCIRDRYLHALSERKGCGGIYELNTGGFEE